MSCWATPYIGLPYQIDGQPPETFNCWTFFAFVERVQFGRDVPVLATPPPSSFALARALKAGGAEAHGWKPTEVPIDGDGVLLHRFRQPSHCGIWVEELQAVLHCQPGGSVLHDRYHLDALRWRICGFYGPA